MTRRTLCRMLERLGCRGYEADSIEAAKEKFAAIEPVLVMLDLQLKDGDGLELCKHLRSMGATVPIVICSSHNEREIVTAAIEAGATDFIIKPFQAPTVRERLARHLPR